MSNPCSLIDLLSMIEAINPLWGKIHVHENAVVCSVIMGIHKCIILVQVNYQPQSQSHMWNIATTHFSWVRSLILISAYHDGRDLCPLFFQTPWKCPHLFRDGIITIITIVFVIVIVIIIIIIMLLLFFLFLLLFLLLSIATCSQSRYICKIVAVFGWW